MSLLDEIIAKLAQGIPLPASNRDHELTGNYAGHTTGEATPLRVASPHKELRGKAVTF
ncbi:MAG: hypothetical protein KGZ57_09205 [Dethiobacter sp.]|nr:hypothetical protein [Dethiobacter sp.]